LLAAVMIVRFGFGASRSVLDGVIPPRSRDEIWVFGAHAWANDRGAAPLSYP
jgi:hypothetical protein